MAEGRSGTLDDLLTPRRQRCFVGRTDEIELFRGALVGAEPRWWVLFLYGPGGIGKTSLLDVFADVAAESGVTPIRIDGREVPPSPGSLLDAVGAAIGARGAGDVLDALPTAGRGWLCCWTGSSG